MPDYTRFYHDAILAGFLQKIRDELPEFTETDPHDPLLQLARLIAFEGHRWSSQMDFLAQEMFQSTAMRRSSWVDLGKMAGYLLAADNPATVDVSLKLSGTPAPNDVIVEQQASFYTRADNETASVPFEHLGQSVTPGNLTFMALASDQAGTSPAGILTPPNTGGTTLNAALLGTWGDALNDALYVGHANLMFDRYTVEWPGLFTGLTTVIEYYDNHNRSVSPLSTAGHVQLGVNSTIVLRIDGLIHNTAFLDQVWNGAVVRVTCQLTGESEDVVVQWDPNGNLGHTITTGSALGQSVISTLAEDYRLSAEWLPVFGAAGASAGAGTTDADQLASGATVSTTPQGAVHVYAIPGLNPGTRVLDKNWNQYPGRRWSQGEVNGTLGWWIRERVITTTGAAFNTPASVIMAPITGQPTNTEWAVLSQVTQGRTVVDQLGVATGARFETFPLNNEPFVSGSLTAIETTNVGAATWLPVDSLYGSGPDDLVYMLDLHPSGVHQVVFGDGVTGARLVEGSVVTATYRTAASNDGNVGIDTITAFGGGVQYVASCRNARAATGWVPRDGVDAAAIELLRRRVPGSMRARTRAVTPEDCEYLALSEFKTVDGRQPFSRIAAIENGSGYKTTKLVCVGSTSQVPNQRDVDELVLFFNGYEYGAQRFSGRALSNQRVFAVPYTPVIVNLAVTIEVVKQHAGAARTLSEAALRSGMSPTSQRPDGSYRWIPGTKISDAAIKLLVGESGASGVVDVNITSPALPITLTSTQLPMLGTLQITIVEVA